MPNKKKNETNPHPFSLRHYGCNYTILSSFRDVDEEIFENARMLADVPGISGQEMDAP